MEYIKKMCILRQIKQGFSGDGKSLSGVVKIEQYGKNLAVEVSIINFAPLSLGEYYCILSDGSSHAETLPLRAKSLFNILTDMDFSSGFCAVICFVKDTITPIAYGVNGNGNYNWKNILNTALPPTFSSNAPQNAPNEVQDENAKTQDFTPSATAEESEYDDETVASENYYKDSEYEQNEFTENRENARATSASEEQVTQKGVDLAENEDATGVRHSFTTDGDGYYLSVKSEMDDLLKKYPKDDTLKGAFCCSEWIRVKGDEDNPQYLVGLIYEENKPKYICYALFAEDKDNPPNEIRDVCTFVPVSPFSDSQGFFVIFQSTATGECIKPLRV